MFALEAVGQALQMAFFMFWEVLWPLALGFLISAVVQSLVSKRAVVRVLGREDLRGLTFATLAGAASSSCSYAAVAVARGLVRKGAAFGNAMVFEFASTNLVFELGLVLLVLLGWQFLAAEFAGGLLMIAMLAIAFKYTLRARMVAEARKQADKGLSGRMEGHGAMDMSITDGPFLARLFSGRSLTAVSHYFYMDLASLWQDLLLGFLISGALAAWVPNSFWQALFLTDNPTLGAIWGPVIGPVISMLSFVCSVGNVPLAVVLWNGGISFGGVVRFIFADLIILPLLRRDGSGRAHRGCALRGLRPGSRPPLHRRVPDPSRVELHDRPQFRFLDPGRGARLALLAHRRSRDAARDGALARRVGQSHHGSGLRDDGRSGERRRTLYLRGQGLLLLFRRLQGRV